jgi:hypothetical protein
MTTITCAAVWLLFPLIVLIGVVYWITEGRDQRIRRWRKQGESWAAIGRRLGCAPSTAKRWAAA